MKAIELLRQVYAEAQAAQVADDLSEASGLVAYALDKATKAAKARDPQVTIDVRRTIFPSSWCLPAARALSRVHGLDVDVVGYNLILSGWHT